MPGPRLLPTRLRSEQFVDAALEEGFWPTLNAIAAAIRLPVFFGAQKVLLKFLQKCMSLKSALLLAHWLKVVACASQHVQWS